MPNLGCNVLTVSHVQSEIGLWSSSIGNLTYGLLLFNLNYKCTLKLFISYKHVLIPLPQKIITILPLDFATILSYYFYLFTLTRKLQQKYYKIIDKKWLLIIHKKLNARLRDVFMDKVGRNVATSLLIKSEIIFFKET